MAQEELVSAPMATPAITKAPVADVLLSDTITSTATTTTAMTSIIPTCPKAPAWGFSSRPEEAEAYWPC